MNIAFIPVRGGSKSIPLKNIRPMNGKPLVYWTVKAACECSSIDQVCVATDSDAIRDTVNTFRKEMPEHEAAKLQLVDRSPETASDTASTESAMLEFAKNHTFETMVLVQATSPLLQASDLDHGFEAYHHAGTDSVLSVVRQKRFHWAVDKEGCATPTNYDVFNRPRRQEFDGYLVENGAFYITSREALLSTSNRVSGKIEAVEMPEATFFEIDEPEDWIIIEALMKRRDSMTESTSKSMREIKMFLTDCDGCLTDGGMYYSENGDELKKFNTRDGMGFQILREKGILTGIVTGENVDLNRRRAEKLKLDILKPGAKNKSQILKDLAAEYHISTDQILYIGDDRNDLGAIELAGFSCAPADAIEAVKAKADYVTTATGGHGVIREVVEKFF